MTARPARDRLFALMAIKPKKRNRALDAHRAEVLAEAESHVRSHRGSLNGKQWPQAAGDLIAQLATLAAGQHATSTAGKDTSDGTQSPAGESTQPAELLALAVVLEIPRPGTALPIQLRLSHGHADRWAICDRTGRRWYPEGWMYEPADDRKCDDGRFTLAEAVPLARKLAGSGDAR